MTLGNMNLLSHIDNIKKQSDYKPGSVPTCVRCGACHLSRPYVTAWFKRSTLWLGRATLIAPVYMNLQLPRCTAVCVTTTLVGSYPTFSPLPLRAVVFFCITQPSRTPSILGSGMPYAARTFLFSFG